MQAGLLLGPGGEFGFVILGLARAEGLIGADVARFPLVLAAATMASIPLLSTLGRRCRAAARQCAADRSGAAVAARPTTPRRASSSRDSAASAKRSPSLLERHRVAYVAVDGDTDRVADAAQVAPTGILGRHHAARSCCIACTSETARALVVTLGDHAASDRLVAAARAARPDLLIIARARDARHAAHLYAIGATDAVPETIEASLQLSEAVLVEIGVAMGPVIATIHERRAELQARDQGDGTARRSADARPPSPARHVVTYRVRAEFVMQIRRLVASRPSDQAVVQATPLPISISRPMRSRPPDSNSASFVLTSCRTCTPRRIGQHQIRLRDGANARLDRIPVFIEAGITVLARLSFDPNLLEPGIDQQRLQADRVAERE